MIVWIQPLLPNANVQPNPQETPARSYIAFKLLHIQINRKRPRITIIHFYKLAGLHIRRHFFASLSIQVSYSGQPVKCTRKYCTKNPCHKIYQCIPELPTSHYKLRHTTTIIHTKTLFLPACHLLQKISFKTKLSHSPLIHPCTLYTPPPTSKYNSK